MSNALEKSSKSKKGKTENFMWTDNEVELLLKMRAVNWFIVNTSSFIYFYGFSRPHENNFFRFLKNSTLDSFFKSLGLWGGLIRICVDGTYIVKIFLRFQIYPDTYRQGLIVLSIRPSLNDELYINRIHLKQKIMCKFISLSLSLMRSVNLKFTVWNRPYIETHDGLTALENGKNHEGF